MAGSRKEKVADLIQEEVARWLTSELRDRNLGFVTVIGVRMSGDLRHARIHVSILEEGERREALLKALEAQKGALRRHLGAVLRLRYTPEIAFVLDTTLETSARIDRLLNDLKASSPPDEDEDR